MPFRESVSSLQELALDIVADHTTELKNGIKELPYHLIEELIDLKSEMKQPLPADVFIHPHMESLDNLSFFDPQTPRIVDKVINTCKKLTELNMTNCSYFTASDAEKLVKNFPNVKCIRLARNEWCDDELLTAIGGNCRRLEILELTCCKSVTDVGLRNLLVNNNNNYVKDWKLHRLEINETKVTPEGCVFALKSFPHLKTLHYHNWAAVVTLLLASNNSGNEEIYGLQSSDSPFGLCGVIDLLTVSKIFPTLENFIGEGSTNNDEFQLVIAPALRNTNDLLTRLYLYNIQRIDLEKINCNCSQLIKLLFHDCTFSLESNFRRLEKHFQLRNLEMLFMSFETVPCISEEFFFNFLSICPCLTYLSLTGCPVLNDSMIEKCIRNGNVLKCLEWLLINNCNSISIESVMKLVELKSPLVAITVSECNNLYESSVDVVNDYVEKNNLNFVYEIEIAEDD